MPIGINTKNDDDLVKSSGFGLTFEDETYKFVSMSGVLHLLNYADVECDYFRRDYCDYYLEYLYNDNVKIVYKSKYKKIIDYIYPEEYLWFGNNYILCIKKYEKIDSSMLLFSRQTVKMPDLKAENIEKIVKYIGVPDYDYYAKNADNFINYLKSDKDLYVVQKEEISDDEFIDALVKEQNETGRIKKFVERETAEHKKEIQDMQKRVDADGKSNQKIIGTVKVYYKIYFKDQSFPFRLILY